MLLGTYRLQSPNGRELQALVHGNRLVRAYIRTTEELRQLWASPSTKDALRRRNIRTELIPSEPENTDRLERLLLETDEEDPDPNDEIRDCIEVAMRPRGSSGERKSKGGGNASSRAQGKRPREEAAPGRSTSKRRRR